MTICSETFGGRGDPAVLLIMGAMASMLWWPDEFCEGGPTSSASGWRAPAAS